MVSEAQQELRLCRNAAQCESLGHRPRKRQVSNAEALKGRDGDAQ